MFAYRARFRGGVPLVDFHQRAPVPTGFVVQLAHELTPADVADGFGKVRVLDHVLHRQTLRAYDLVFVNDARREVVLVVPPAISDTGVNAGDLGPRFAPVLRAFFLPGEPPLRSRQSLLVPGKILRVGDLPVRRDHKRFQAQVQPDHLWCDGERCDLLTDQDGDEVAARAISGDGDTRRFGPLWKRAVPDNGKWGVHLGERQGGTVPGEGVCSVGRALLIPLLLKGGVVGAPLEEVHVSPFKVAQRLLDRDGGHLGQKWVLLLQGRQHRCQIVVEEALALLEIGRLAGRKPPVVDEAHTTERAGKLPHLLRRWVKSISVGPFRRCAHRFPPFLVLDWLKGLEQVYYTESNMSSESAWEGVPLHPGPETRNAPSIPVSEDRGFTARFDKEQEDSVSSQVEESSFLEKSA
jgi:hypothetical protein